MRESTGPVLRMRAAFGAGATVGGDGSAWSGARSGPRDGGAGARKDWLTRTAEAPSPTQNALHAVLIHRSIVLGS